MIHRMARRDSSFELALPPRQEHMTSYRWLYESVRGEILPERPQYFFRVVAGLRTGRADRRSGSTLNYNTDGARSIPAINSNREVFL